MPIALQIALVAAIALAGGALPSAHEPAPLRLEPRDSRAVGEPHDGRLVRGVRLPAEGRDFYSWDPILRQTPSRPWRRWATDDTIRRVVRAVSEYRAAHPDAPRVGIGDLSRPQGGDFGPKYGIVGHATHQNGRDVDVYFPLRDKKERPPNNVAEIDRRLAQALVDAFVAAGAELVYVGPGTGLTGPEGVVTPAAGHDDHLHARMPR